MRRPIKAGIKCIELMRLCLLCILILSLSCNGQRKVTQAADSSNTKNPLTLLVSDSYSGYTTAETFVIKDTKTLKRFFSKVNSTRKPGIPVPEIDFSKEIIIIQCGEEKSKVNLPVLYVLKETDQEMILGVKKNADTTSSNFVFSPFKVYKMPFIDKAIKFQEQ